MWRYPEDGGSRVLQNVRKFLQDYKESDPRKAVIIMKEYISLFIMCSEYSKFLLEFAKSGHINVYSTDPLTIEGRTTITISYPVSEDGNSTSILTLLLHALQSNNELKEILPFETFLKIESSHFAIAMEKENDQEALVWN